MTWPLLILMLVFVVAFRISVHACAHVDGHPLGLCDWLRALRTRRVKVVIAQPHHYCVAAGLSLLMFGLGHYSVEHHVAAWGYAILESITTAGE